MRTTKSFRVRGTGFLARVSLAIGLMMIGATGCGLDTPGGIDVTDCVPQEDGVPDGCPNETPTESIVPIGVDVELGAPSR